MSKCNKRNQARIQELLATRTFYVAPHKRSVTQKVTGVLIQRGKLELRNVAFENKATGEKKFGKMLVRSASVTLSHGVRS